MVAGGLVPIPKKLRKEEEPWNIMKLRHKERLDVVDIEGTAATAGPAPGAQTHGAPGRAIRFSIAAGQHGNPSGAAFFANPFHLLPSESINLSYSVYLPPDWDWVRAGKLGPGVGLGKHGLDHSSGGCWHDECGSFRMMWRDPQEIDSPEEDLDDGADVDGGDGENGLCAVEEKKEEKHGKNNKKEGGGGKKNKRDTSGADRACLKGYCYPQIPGGPGPAYAAQGPLTKAVMDPPTNNRTGCNIWWKKGGGMFVQRGCWNDVSYSIRLNTPGQADGYLRVCINGHVRESTDVAWRADPLTKICSVYFVTIFGGSTMDFASPHDTYALYKDVVVTV